LLHMNSSTPLTLKTNFPLSLSKIANTQQTEFRLYLGPTLYKEHLKLLNTPAPLYWCNGHPYQFCGYTSKGQTLGIRTSSNMDNVEWINPKHYNAFDNERYCITPSSVIASKIKSSILKTQDLVSFKSTSYNVGSHFITDINEKLLQIHSNLYSGCEYDLINALVETNMYYQKYNSDNLYLHINLSQYSSEYASHLFNRLDFYQNFEQKYFNLIEDCYSNIVAEENTTLESFINFKNHLRLWHSSTLFDTEDCLPQADFIDFIRN
jgi:hypothetical protein